MFKPVVLGGRQTGTAAEHWAHKCWSMQTAAGRKSFRELLILGNLYWFLFGNLCRQLQVVNMISQASSFPDFLSGLANLTRFNPSFFCLVQCSTRLQSLARKSNHLLNKWQYFEPWHKNCQQRIIQQIEGMTRQIMRPRRRSTAVKIWKQDSLKNCLVF